MFSFLQPSMRMGNQEKLLWRRGKFWIGNITCCVLSEAKDKKMLHFTQPSFLSPQYDWIDAGDLHCLLCRDSWSGLKFLCTAIGFRGLKSVFTLPRILWILSKILTYCDLFRYRWPSVLACCCWSLCLCSSSSLWVYRETWCHPYSPSLPWLSCSMPSSCSRWVHTAKHPAGCQTRL